MLLFNNHVAYKPNGMTFDDKQVCVWGVMMGILKLVMRNWFTTCELYYSKDK